MQLYHHARLNSNCNQYLCVQQSPQTMLVWQMVFGPVLKMHILMSGCFTWMHQAKLVQFPPHSRNMRMSKKSLRPTHQTNWTVFTPLVFSSTGGLGREATISYKRLADLLAHKRDKPYPVIMAWLRCKLSFAAVCSSILCIRGSISSANHPVRDLFDITLATSEGGVSLAWH